MTVRSVCALAAPGPRSRCDVLERLLGGVVNARRSIAAIALSVLAACEQAQEPTPDTVQPGDLRYTVSYAGGAAPTTTWTGTARLVCIDKVAAELSATSTAPGSDAWWSLSGDVPAHAVGPHPIRGGGGSYDTLLVWWGHLVTGDSRTHGTLTVNLTTPSRLDAHFVYTGPAGVGTDTVMATVQGDFSALLPPYVTNPGC